MTGCEVGRSCLGVYDDHATSLSLVSQPFRAVMTSLSSLVRSPNGIRIPSAILRNSSRRQSHAAVQNSRTLASLSTPHLVSTSSQGTPFSGIRARFFHHGPETVIPPLVSSTSSPEFIAKAEAMDALVADLEQHLSTARLGGGEAALAKMRSKGKKTPRERLGLLLDPESPWLELSSLAGHEVYEGQRTPGAGLITGIGRIAGRECMVIVNDASVKGGSYLPLTVRFSW